MRPYLEIITRQGNLSREFSKNTREGLHTCVFPSIHMSHPHPSFIRDSLALLPRTFALSAGLQQPCNPHCVPFYGVGWGGYSGNCDMVYVARLKWRRDLAPTCWEGWERAR